MVQQVRAYGQVLQFPDDMSDDDMAKAIQNNEHVLNPNFKAPEGLSGIAKNVVSGTKQTGRMVGAGFDTIRNELAGVEDYAKASDIARQQETPIEQRKLLGELSSIDRDQGALRQIGDTLSAAGRNPMGTAQMITEQLPNTAVSLGGGYAGFKTGAAAGALFGPVGATIGGTLGFLGGMFLGNVLLETGGKAIEKASDEDGYTPEDRDNALREGAVKGAVITGVDAATLKLGSMVTNRLGAAATNAGAKAEAKVLIEAGVDMSSTSAINAALKSSPELLKSAKVAGEKAAIQALSKSKKAGIIGTGLVLETAGEGIGEYAGEMAATGKGDVVDATIEALSSATQSIAETAYNFNKLKSGNDLSADGMRKVADSVNEITLKDGINNISKSQSVDEAIQSAVETVSAKQVTANDVLKTVDPTLLDVERLTGLKPSEVINDANLQGEQDVKNEASQEAKQKAGQKPVLLGNDTEIVLPDGQSIPAKWGVVDANQVSASIKEGINQPRDRTRAASDIQIQGIANNPDYRRLSDSVLMDTGSPTLSYDGLIVGGNGRFEGISRAHETGASEKYRESLLNDALSKGIDVSLIQGIKSPVLVRQITQPFDTRKLAVASNSGTNMQYSGLELAKIDAGRMFGIEDLDIADNGDIAMTGLNFQRIKQSLADYNQSEIAAIVDKNGALSQDGVKRIRNAILAKAYGNSETLGRMVESTDNDMRNVLGALTRTSGTVARVRSEIKSGAIPEELDITDNLLNAVETLAQIRSKGQPLDHYLSQENMFGDNIDSDSKEILQYLHDNIRSQKKMAEFINNVYGQIGSIDQSTEDIFGDNVVPTKKEVIDNAKPTEQDEQQGIFSQQKPSGTNEQESKTEADNATSDQGRFSRSPEERLKDRERAKQLERKLREQGFNFTVTAKDVRDFTSGDRDKENEADAAEKIAKIFGRRIVWIEARGDHAINGVVIPSIKDTIFIDVNTDKAAHAVMGHELSHHLEHDKPEVYKELTRSLMTVIRDHPGYAKKYGIEGARQSDITKEIVGDIMGDNFTKPEFWNRVAEANPSVFKNVAGTIISWLKRLIINAKARSLGSEQWVTDAQKAQDIVAKAVAQYTSQSNTPASGKAKFHSAFHGSPHDYDKFDSSKIGTGEGAQAYGHGLYFAESKDVAEYYKKVLTDGKMAINGIPFEPKNYTITKMVANHKGSDDSLISRLETYIKWNSSNPYAMTEDAQIVIDALKDGTLTKKVGGKLYQVELAPKQDEYLLWDKPLLEQSDKVIASLEKKFSLPSFDKDFGTAGEFYRSRARKFDSQEKASSELYSLGIRGIKYLDGSSRHKKYVVILSTKKGEFSRGEFDNKSQAEEYAKDKLEEGFVAEVKFNEDGNFNYVIFDENDITITAKFSKKATDDQNKQTFAQKVAAYQVLDAKFDDDNFIKNLDIDSWEALHNSLQAIRDDIANALENNIIDAIDANGKRLLSRNSTDSGNDWRITSFDADGDPLGHSEYRNAKRAVDDLFVSGINQNWKALSKDDPDAVKFSRASQGSLFGNNDNLASQEEVLKANSARPGDLFSSSNTGGVQQNTAISDDMFANTGSVEKSFSVSSDSIRRVMSGMIRSIGDLQVREAIIKLVPIDVMNDLAGEKFSANTFLNNPSVLTDSFPVSESKLSVPVTRFFNSLSDGFASNGAEVLNRLPSAKRIFQNYFSTLSAADLNLFGQGITVALDRAKIRASDGGSISLSNESIPAGMADNLDFGSVGDIPANSGTGIASGDDFGGDSVERSAADLAIDIRHDKNKKEKTIIPDQIGQKLGGARKDMERSLNKEYTDDDIATQPLSKIWPKDDYLNIEDQFLSAFYFAAREEIPAKPRVSYKIPSWVNKVKMFRGLARLSVSGAINEQKIIEFSKKYPGLERFFDRVQVLSRVPNRNDWGRVEQISIYPNAGKYDENGLFIKSPMTQIKVDGRTTITNVTEIDQVADSVNNLLKKEKPSDDKKMQFELRGRTGSYFINKKGDREYRKLKTFTDLKEASQYLKNNYDDLVAAWELVKESDNVKKTDVRGEENRPRTGQDWRGQLSQSRVLQTFIKSADVDAQFVSDSLIRHAGVSHQDGRINIPRPFGTSDWPITANSVNPKLRERPSYMAVVSINLLRNLSETESFGVELLSKDNIPLVAAVQEAMLTLGHNDKVLRSVVERVPIDVVNFLSREKISTESLFRDKSVLKSFFSVNSGMSVGAAIRNNPIISLIKSVTLDRTEVVGANDPARISLESDTALMTGQFDSGLAKSLFSHDVSPDEFYHKFSFRGVEFGNWVSQGKDNRERQGMLNQAYDALMDLSNIVGVPPKALSLNGSLGLGFGSRGKGAALAHFEPGALVINLTKTKGAGNLAHEWFHAMDNYFQRKRGELKPVREDMFITYRPEQMMMHKKSGSLMTQYQIEKRRLSNPTAGYFSPENWVKDPNHPMGVRPEVEAKFSDLVKALDESPMKKRAEVIDKGKEDGYWSRIIERAARSFENYVIAKMMKKGYNNDYLANVTNAEDFARDKERYPYLLESEVAPVEEAFDNLFSEIKTKETDKGVAMFSRVARKIPKPITINGKSLSQFADAIARRYKANKIGQSKGSRYYSLPDGREIRVSDHEFPRKHGGGVAQIDIVYNKEDDGVDIFHNEVKVGAVTKELSYRSLNLRGGDIGGLEGFNYDIEAWEAAVTKAIDDAISYSSDPAKPTDNNGEFSSDNDDIRFSFAGKKSETTEGVSPERTNSLDIPRESRFRKFQRKYQDSFNRFTVVKEWLADKGINLSQQADVYAAEERYHAKIANQVEDFREQIRNPLIEKIAKAGFTMDDIADYLEAQHAPEANAAIRKLRDDPEATAYGIADDEAKEYLSKAPGELGKLANELRSITEQTKKLRLDGGLLNKDITDAWEATYKHYIPVKGAEQGNSGTGKGMSVKVKNKRRLGHGRRDEAVIENILQDHERAIMEVEKNRVGKHVVMMAAEIGIPELMTIGQPAKRQMLRNTTAYEVQVKGRTKAVFDTKEGANLFRQSLPLTDKKIALSDVVINPTADQRVVMSASPMLADNEINVYIDGHAIRVQINDELMARAYKKLGIEGYGEIVSAGRMLNSYLSKVYTGYNPEFIMTNMVRDFTTGVINLTGEQGLKMAAKAISNYPKSFATLLRYAATNGKQSTDWIDAYRRNGGNTGAAYLSDMERLGNEVASEYAAYQGVIANLKQGDMANAARAAGRKAYNATLKWIYNLNQAGENAMRLSAFKAMIDSGMNVNDAAKAAKNITVNFNRKGELGVEANAAYLFFNASVQGTAATLHALVKGKNKYQAWALASGLTTLGYLAAASLGGGGEDDYDKIDDYTKERNAVIKYGDGYLKLPIPYGYGFFWNIGRSMADAQRKDELHTMPWHIAASAIEELTPFGSIVVGSDGEFKSDQVLGGALPTVAQIPYQISNNKQLFSGGELMPDSPFDQSQPDREKMWRGTKGTMYDQVSGWLAGAGMDVSPETLKFMTRTATGGAGALVDSSVSAAMLKADGAELDSAEMPFIRKAYKEISIKDTRSAFYKAREEAKLAAEEFNRARRKNDLVAMQTVINDKKEMLALDAYADKLSEVIRYARDQQDAVRLNKDIPIAEKRLRLKELEMNESKFYDKYLDVFNINKIEMKKRVNQ